MATVMDARIHVFLSHDLPRFDDTAATLARLQMALPAALAVRDYWRSIDPGRQALTPPAQRREVDVEAWQAAPVMEMEPDERRYVAPGSLFLVVMPTAALIFTGGRWRRFLSV